MFVFSAKTIPLLSNSWNVFLAFPFNPLMYFRPKILLLVSFYYSRVSHTKTGILSTTVLPIDFLLTLHLLTFACIISMHSISKSSIFLVIYEVWDATFKFLAEEVKVTHFKNLLRVKRRSKKSTYRSIRLITWQY